MTKRHFEAVAANMREHAMSTKGKERERVRLMCIDLAGLFAAENPRFDRARFLTACGFGE